MRTVELGSQKKCFPCLSGNRWSAFRHCKSKDIFHLTDLTKKGTIPLSVDDEGVYNEYNWADATGRRGVHGKRESEFFGVTGEREYSYRHSLPLPTGGQEQQDYVDAVLNATRPPETTPAATPETEAVSVGEAGASRAGWYPELKAIRDEQNKLRKLELLRAVEARYGIRADNLTKRWLGIRGYQDGGLVRYLSGGDYNEDYPEYDQGTIHGNYSGKSIESALRMEKLLGKNQIDSNVLSGRFAIGNTTTHSDGNGHIQAIQKWLKKGLSNFDYSPVSEDDFLQTRDIVQRASGLLELSPKEIKQLSSAKIILNTPTSALQPGTYGSTSLGGFTKIGDKNARQDVTFDEALSHELYHGVQVKLHGLNRAVFGRPLEQKPIYPIVEGSAESVLKNVNPDIYEELKDKIAHHGLSSVSILNGLPDEITKGIKTTTVKAPTKEAVQAALRNYALPSVVLQDYKNQLGVKELDQWVKQAIDVGTPGTGRLSQLAVLLGGNDSGNAKKLAEHIRKVSNVVGYQSGGKIPGFGGGDRVPILAEQGEYVVNKHSTANNRQLLDAINAGRVQRLQYGGMVEYAAKGGQQRGGSRFDTVADIVAPGSGVAPARVMSEFVRLLQTSTDAVREFASNVGASADAVRLAGEGYQHVQDIIATGRFAAAPTTRAQREERTQIAEESRNVSESASNIETMPIIMTNNQNQQTSLAMEHLFWVLLKRQLYPILFSIDYKPKHKESVASRCYFFNLLLRSGALGLFGIVLTGEHLLSCPTQYDFEYAPASEHDRPFFASCEIDDCLAPPHSMSKATFYHPKRQDFSPPLATPSSSTPATNDHPSSIACITSLAFSTPFADDNDDHINRTPHQQTYATHVTQANLS